MSIEYKCKICNKQYKTYQTLWKHNKNFHNNNTLNSTSTVLNSTSTVLLLYLIVLLLI